MVLQKKGVAKVVNVLANYKHAEKQLICFHINKEIVIGNGMNTIIWHQ